MGNVISNMMLSVDGYVEGADGTIDWHRADGEHSAYAAQLLDSAGALLFGRVTYELMASYWPTDEAAASDPAIAERMNRMPKIVFSRTIDRVSWQNTALTAEASMEEVSRLKRQFDKPLLILGSAKLMSSFANLGLVDEYHVIVNPVALGKGTPLFQGLRDRLHLELIAATPFRSGNVLLRYRPAP